MAFLCKQLVDSSTLNYICISEICVHVLKAYRNKPTWRSGGIIPKETAWRNTAVSNDRQSSLSVFNYHLGRIKHNPVGVVGDIAKACELPLTVVAVTPD